jgi:hypothetical protein
MRGVGGLAAIVLLVAGCAAPPLSPAPPASQTPTTPRPSSIACPQVEGVELPPECIPYDPDAYINSNLAYKDRMPVTEKAFAGFEAKREEVEDAIAALQESDNVTIDSVADVLEGAGFGPHPIEPVRTWENLDGVHFMAGGPTDGCVEGTVTVDDFEMALKGYINDGGCIAAVGH